MNYSNLLEYCETQTLDKAPVLKSSYKVVFNIVSTRLFCLVSQSLPQPSEMIEKITLNCIERLNQPKKPNITNLEKVRTPRSCAGPVEGLFKVTLSMPVISALKQYKKFPLLFEII